MKTGNNKIIKEETMRRYVAFTMALVVASALLAGCSSKDKTEDNTNTTAVSGTAVQESKEEAPTESGDKTKEKE